MPRKLRPLPNWQDPLSEPTLGGRVRAGRLALWKGPKKIGHKEFLALADISGSALDEIEIGKVKFPKVPTLKKLSKALGFSQQELLEGRADAAAVAPGDTTDATVMEIVALGVRLHQEPTPELRARFAELSARYTAASGYSVTREAGRPSPDKT